jgi:hypothetical protein
MNDEFVGGWNATEEKLVCLIVLDDDITEKIGVGDVQGGYLRGFVVRNRTSGNVTARYRFNQPDGQSWYEIKPKGTADTSEGAESLCRVLEAAFTKVSRGSSVDCFYPPDDNGCPMATVLWLEKLDLIERLPVTTTRDLAVA